MLIPKDLYKEIQRTMPILCVDVLVRYGEEYLLIERTQEPMKGQYWVIGGRVHRNEELVDAVKRKMKEEINIIPQSIKFMGVYEDQYPVSELGVRDYHTVAIVFEATVESLEGFQLDGTSGRWKLSSVMPERFSKFIRLNDI